MVHDPVDGTNFTLILIYVPGTMGVFYSLSEGVSCRETMHTNNVIYLKSIKLSLNVFSFFHMNSNWIHCICFLLLSITKLLCRYDGVQTMRCHVSCKSELLYRLGVWSRVAAILRLVTYCVACQVVQTQFSLKLVAFYRLQIGLSVCLCNEQTTWPHAICA